MDDDNNSKRLEGHDEVSYLDIARTANQMNRKRLATMLLDMEPHANNQVPLLLAMHEEEAALAKAIARFAAARAILLPHKFRSDLFRLR